MMEEEEVAGQEDEKQKPDEAEKEGSGLICFVCQSVLLIFSGSLVFTYRLSYHFKAQYSRVIYRLTHQDGKNLPLT